MKKFLSLLLTVSMLIGTFCLCIPANAESTGCTVTEDGYLDAVCITPDAADANVSYTASVSLPSGETGYAALWLPATAADTELSVRLNGEEKTLRAGHKFEVLPFTANGNGLEVSFTSSDTSSVYLCKTVSSDADVVNIAANGTLAQYDEEYLHLDHYEVSRYVKPYWDEDIVFNESFYAVTDPDGSIAPISLMYDIDRVASVKNFYLKVEYTYGKDYTIEDGKLIINPEGSIPVHLYSDIFAGRQLSSSFRAMLDGGYAFCGQVNEFTKGYLNITYTTKDTWDGVIPENKGNLLPKISEKLNTPGETVKLLSIGDSLAGGANASGNMGVAPYADIWCDMAAKGIQEMYTDVTVETQTIAQGGATAGLAIEKMKAILEYGPDLMFIEFGTNECMNGDSPFATDGYIDTIEKAIASVKAVLPDCEFVLVAPIISNPIFFPTDWFYKYADSLYTIEREGVAVSDSVSIYQYLMSKKRYIDMTGDFLCHPSDFGTRIFVQTILETVKPSTDANIIAGYADRIENYRYSNEFRAEEWAEYTALAAEAKAAVAAKTTLDGARETYLAYAERLDAVPTAAEILKNSTIDTANLIFNNTRQLDVISSSVGVNSRIIDEDECVVLSSLAPRNCSYVLDYKVGDKLLSTDDYGHLVLTCKVSLTNSTRSNSSVYTFSVTDGEGSVTALAGDTVNYIRDGAYHSYIIDMSEKAGWTGYIDSLKSNMFNPINTGDELNITSIILTSDKESAEAVAAERAFISNKLSATAETFLMTAETTPSLIPAAESYILGDCDENGTVNSRDMLSLRKYLAEITKSEEFTVPMDMDRDGYITVGDVTLLKKTLAGIFEVKTHTDPSCNVAYDSVNEAAKIDITENGASVKFDLAGKEFSANLYKYVTVCAKTDKETDSTVTVKLTTSEGSYEKALTVPTGTFFTADSVGFINASGEIESVEFFFDANAGDTVFFDSFVLTPYQTMARNAETVRVGAANLVY